MPVWSPINNLFDEWWSNKYAIRCQSYDNRMPCVKSLPGKSYGNVYRLYEFLWKMKVIKLL